MNQDHKNLFAAIFLSIVVLVGWQYFVGAPKMEKARIDAREQQIVRPAAPNAGAQDGTPGVAAPSSAPAAAPTAALQPVRPRAELLAAGPRIAIDTDSLKGSIALKGARIDDVLLKKYRETPDAKSPNIVLLSPAGSEHPFYAELGFVAAAGQKASPPGADTLWTADAQILTATKPVTLSWDNGQGLMFKRRISIDNDYLFSVVDTVENTGAGAVALHPFALVARHGKPPLQGYAVLHEGLVGVVGDSGVQEWAYDKIEKETGAQKRFKGTGGWVGFTDKYWAAVVAPDQTKPFDASMSATPATPTVKNYQADAVGEAINVAPGGKAEAKTYIFAGVKVSELLDRYQADPGLSKFELLIDWGWFYFITKPLFKLLDLIYKLIGNFGLAILAVTVLVKIAFLPLANKSYLSMAKMKALQPQMKAIQERYPDDKVKQQQEQMELFKREKVNPVSGCLPMLVQIPVFFALYKVLFVTIEMRQAPFFGWIKDLSQPDPTNIFNLFGLLPFDPTHVPVFGSFLWLGVWPLIMGVSMWVQMKMNPEATDPVQRQMFAWMPVIFTFMLGSFPVGLVIYWTWNNILSVAQQWWIMKRAGVPFELWDNLVKSFRRKTA